jgi:hypothetical protein
MMIGVEEGKFCRESNCGRMKELARGRRGEGKLRCEVLNDNGWRQE